MKKGLSLEPITVKRIETMSEQTRRYQGAIVDIAIERLATSPEFAALFATTPKRSTKIKTQTMETA